MSKGGTMTEAGQSLQDDQATHSLYSTSASHMATKCHKLDVSEIIKIDILSYDWEKTLKQGRAFKIPDIDWEINSFEDDFMVPEPPSLSGIIDSTTNNSSSSKTTDKEENYIVDDMSSLSDISDVKISTAPKKHTFGKERVERKGNIYNKLYNACLNAQISIINNTLKKCTGIIIPDEDGRTPLYAACIGDHLEVVMLLIESGYDINHQDNDGKTPLHVAFENHALDLSEILMIQFQANIQIRDKRNWTPLHTAIDRGYYRYSQQLAQFLCQDVDTEVSWIQLQAACFEENTKYVKFLLDAKTNINHSSSAGHTPLHIAVKTSNIDIITFLLDKNADINTKTIDGKTPLHIAVEKDREAIIQLLLAQKADVNLQDALGNSILHIAVQAKHDIKPWVLRAGVSNKSPLPTSLQPCSIQIVKAIIELGANVNVVNNKGQTSLWFACLDKQEQLVKILLHNGADLNIADTNNDSILHSAMYGRCSTGIIEEIINHCGHINVVNKDEATPLLLACGTAQTESVRLLLKAKADPNIADADGNTCLHAAIAADCSKEMLQEIIDNGGDVNAVNRRGQTPLLLSCNYKHMDSVLVLLGVGADLTYTDENGFSCLHAAIYGHCSKYILQALIDHGAHIDARTEDGTNALLFACRKGQSESVNFLLEAGADVNIADALGNTILHFAVFFRCGKDTLQKIMCYGVDVNAVNNNNQTALLLACGSALDECVKLLLANGADPNISESVTGFRCLHAAVLGKCTDETLEEIANKAYVNAQAFDGQTALFFACSHRQQNSIKVLLEAAANPNIASAKGHTSLHAAVIGGCSKKIIRSIIKHGSDVNGGNNSSRTSLMIASLQNNAGAINVLLNAGADITITDNTGITCLHHAVMGGCNKEILQTIIDHGADVNATNKNNISPLILACHDGNVDAFDVLVNAGAHHNTQGTQGLSLIYLAAAEGWSKEILQTIIDHGHDVNTIDKDCRTALMLAYWKENVEAIRFLLNAGADPNIANAVGATCIHHAVFGGCNKETLQIIIEYGANVNAIDKNSRTALMLACQKGNVEAINVLLNAGADINIRNANGSACILFAVVGGCHKETLQAIIDHGADINATNEDSRTALMIACVRGDVEAIHVLLNAGADSTITDTNGFTWIHYAVAGGCSKETLQLIIGNGAKVNAIDKNSSTALMLACQTENVEAINVLLNAGTASTITDTNGGTWIHYAVDGGCSKETLQIIIEYGADVNAIDKNNSTALMLACQKGSLEAINVLLNAGADINIRDGNGLTCIHYAVIGGCHKETLQAIIDRGSAVNATSKYNETALRLACTMRSEDAINALLNAEADPNIVDINGYTCLHAAIIEHCSKNVLQELIDHGVHVNARNCNCETALMIACQKYYVEAIDVLLNAGADSNITDTKGFTWIHHAAGGICSKETLQAIIDHGVDINAIDEDGRTVLMISCQMGNVEAINVLLNAGADSNITDTNSGTWIHYAVDGGCSKETLQIIIEYGANVNALDKNNSTALMLACQKGNVEAIKVLLNAGAGSNITDTNGHTWIHYAVASDCSKETLQIIIEYGGDVNALDKNNSTALMLACQKRNVEALNVLLSAGADSNIADTNGDTWIHYAVAGGCSKKTLQTIINHGADVNAIKKDNVMAGMIACQQEDIESINVHLKAGSDPDIAGAKGVTWIKPCADVNVRNKVSETALMIACQRNNADAINVLLHAGADITIIDNRGLMCIHHAVVAGCSKEILQTIIDHGADVNAADKNNISPLILACHDGNVDAIDVLVNAGADHNIQGTQGLSLIHLAVYEGWSKEIFQAIIDHGSDINTIDKDGRTALMLAYRQENVEAISLLLNAGADPNIADGEGATCIHHAVVRGCSKETLQIIIEYGADVNAINKKSSTALMIACQKGNVEAINVLLNAGADINIRNANGATALMLACIMRCEDAINVHLNAEADPNIVNISGDTCLHAAVREHCSKKVLQGLIDHGVDVNTRNKFGITAIMIACMQGVSKKENIDAINVLLNAGAHLTLYMLW